MTTFMQELENLINRYSKENGSNTPDFILAEYLNNCLEAFDKAVVNRQEWYKPDSFVPGSLDERNPRPVVLDAAGKDGA